MIWKMDSRMFVMRMLRRSLDMLILLISSTLSSTFLRGILFLPDILSVLMVPDIIDKSPVLLVEGLRSFSK
jgi:hypothetical protein